MQRGRPCGPVHDPSGELLIRQLAQLVVAEMETELEFVLAFDLSRVVIQNSIKRMPGVGVLADELVIATESGAVEKRPPRSPKRIRQSEGCGVIDPRIPGEVGL